MVCNKCNGRIIRLFEEFPKCIACGWINYDEQLMPTLIKTPPEFLASRMVIPPMATSANIKRKDITVFLNNIIDEETETDYTFRYSPMCPYCNQIMRKRGHKVIGRKPPKGKKDKRIRVILYGCKKSHLIHLHDCPDKGLIYWSYTGKQSDRIYVKKKNKSANSSATPA